jgi:hypothetical protein
VSTLTEPVLARNAPSKVFLSDCANFVFSQWGNLLVLAACYESEVLHAHIDPHVLRDLFKKTITFFKMISNETSALRIDLRLLETIERQLFHDGSASKSFSSNSSGMTPMQQGMSIPPGVPGPPPPIGFAPPAPPGQVGLPM